MCGVPIYGYGSDFDSAIESLNTALQDDAAKEMIEKGAV
jgi:hypothetical protein